jgi:hypothetical protein
MSQHIENGTNDVGARPRVGPRQRVVSVSNADSHQLVPSRVKLNLVQAVAEPIVSVERWRVTVCQFSKPQGLGASHERAEFADFRFGPFAPFSSQCFLQRHVVGEQVVVFQRRGLIEDLVLVPAKNP